MATEDNLNPNLNTQQFMPMDQIHALRSGDDPTGQKTVADMLPKKQQDIYVDHPIEYGSLRSHMRSAGQTAPLTVGPHPETGEPTLYQGHHRVAIAGKLGWSGMHVSPNAMDTDDDAFNQKHGDFFQ